MHSKFIFTPIAAVALLGALPLKALGAEASREGPPSAGAGAFSIAGHLGVGFTNGQGSGLVYGGAVEYGFVPPISTGAFIDHINLGSVSSTAVTLNDSNQSITFYGIEGTDHLDSILPGLQAGVKLGLASTNVTANAPGIYSDTKHNLNVFAGPKVGYEVPIAAQLAAGGELNVLFKTTSDEPIAGYSTVNQVSSVVNVLGSLKYTF